MKADVLSDFDDRLSEPLPAIYSEPSIAVVFTRRLWIVDCRRPGFFCLLEADEKYEHVAKSLHVLLSRYLHRANIFLSQQSVLFRQHMI